MSRQATTMMAALTAAERGCDGRRSGRGMAVKQQPLWQAPAVAEMGVRRAAGWPA